jgi:hypothetical protein
MNVRTFTYLNLCQNCISCVYAQHRAVGFSRYCEFMFCCSNGRFLRFGVSKIEGNMCTVRSCCKHLHILHVCVCERICESDSSLLSHNRWVETLSEHFRTQYCWRPVSPSFRIFWYLEWISVLNAQKIRSCTATLLVAYLGSAANTAWDRDDISFFVLNVGLMVTLLFTFQLKVVMCNAFAVHVKWG